LKRKLTLTLWVASLELRSKSLKIILCGEEVGHLCTIEVIRIRFIFAFKISDINLANLLMKEGRRDVTILRQLLKASIVNHDVLITGIVIFKVVEPYADMALTNPELIAKLTGDVRLLGGIAWP
jgi:hypothetical protein